MNRKQAHAAFNPTPGKNPKTRDNPESYLQRHPSWRVSQLDMVNPFGWHEIDQKTLTYIHNRLSEIEARTWQEILVHSKKQNHTVQTRHIAKSGRDRLSEMGMDDQEELVSLRFTGIERVWGILDQGVLTVLWWDPNHQVCPSLKKHT